MEENHKGKQQHLELPNHHATLFHLMPEIHKTIYNHAIILQVWGKESTELFAKHPEDHTRTIGEIAKE